MFSAIAPHYDLLNHLLSLGWDYRWRRRAAGRLPWQAGGLFLDVATGTADLALEVARQQPASAHIIALDFSHPMLALARHKLRRTRQEGRIHLCQGDALALPFWDGQFDAALMAFGLRNLPDRLAGLREMRRVVRQGGEVVIVEFSTPGDGLWGMWRLAYHLYLQTLLPAIGRILSGVGGAYAYLGGSIRRFPDQEELKGLMEEAGFRRVNYCNLTGGIVALHVGVT